MPLSALVRRASNGFGEGDSACGLQSWTLDASFNQRWELGDLTLPCSLQSSTFDANRCFEKLALPCGLQSLTVDACFNEFGEVDSAMLPAEFDL